MKNYLYPALAFTFSIFLSVSLSGQGIYQLWGMTAQGGPDDIGVVFRTDNNGNNATAVHSFTKTNSGARPMYNQLSEYSGKFYAMTSAGGSNDLGAIFEWDPATNIYIKKYDFEIANGINPHGSLVLLNNKFYGMTLFGGANDQGVIFEWDPVSNLYTKKHDFNGANGSKPYGGLVYNAGKFYGMTNSGGSNNKGVIFQWDPVSNIYQKLHDLDGTNGANPYGDLALHNGKLYGMTNKGGSIDKGVIFEWNIATNTFLNKYEFNDYNIDGGNPYGSLVLFNGKFYGLTHFGGSGDRQGVIFEWDPGTNIYSKKFDFDFTGNPYGNLLLNDGKFYGLVYSEYRSKGLTRGALFEWDPVTNVYTDKFKYTVTTTVDNTHIGESPKGTLVSHGGKLYGMSSEGGSNDDGVIFEWDPASNVYSKKINFNGPQNGQSPNSLVYQQDHLYGVTRQGGKDGLGVIFEWNFATNQYVKKHDVDGDAETSALDGNSRYPQGRLTHSNGKFYGTSFYVLPAPSFHQHIFEWDPATNTFTKKARFTPGIQPTGNLTEYDGKLYGMWQGGGGIFKWDPSTDAYSTLHEFQNVNPSIASSLTVKDGKLYGIANGGDNNAGVIFEWDFAGNTYQNKYHLTAALGSTPTGSMTLHNNKFYGLTDAGGANNKGVLFEWDPVSNIYTKKYDFNDDANPAGQLVVMNGKLFGMTKTGGNAGLGVIFEWDPVTNTYTKKSDFTNTNGRNPADKNVLTVVPVSVAAGTPGACTNYAQVNIGASNNNEWVPIVDENGLAVAEIKANGNQLGIVNASVYINSGAVRKDVAGRAYLDRNITITPQFQPTTPVDVRLYISGEEFASLKNSNAPGINTVNDLGVFKNGDGCGSEIGEKASPVATTAAGWGNDYVLSASISKFSTFYFASKSNVALPLTLLEFSGKLQNNNAVLNWKTEHEINTREFIVERSIDGNKYKAIGNVTAVNQPGQQKYDFTDLSIQGLGSAILYYRLGQKDVDGQVVYSKVVTLALDATNNVVQLYPNPVYNNELNLWIQSTQSETIKWQIIDLSGRTLNTQTRNLAPGINKITIDVSHIPKGIYFINVQGKGDNQWMKFGKQ